MAQGLKEHIDTARLTAASQRSAQLQRRSVRDGVAFTTVPPIVHEVLRSPGEPLDAETQAFFEPRFGHDFSHVRVHTDAKAAVSAQSVNSLAYTIGQHIAFDVGKYAPEMAEGKRLLAHELAHVVQQSASLTMARETAPILIDTDTNTGLEQEATHAAQFNCPDTAVFTHSVSPSPVSCLQRQQAKPSTESEAEIQEGMTLIGAKSQMLELHSTAVRLMVEGQRLLDEWFAAMSAGTLAIPEPEDTEASKYWWIALSGNMAWAATSLLAPELRSVVILVSFAGAAVGSGVAQKVAYYSPPFGRPILITQLAKARDRMEKKLEPLVGEVSMMCVRQGIYNKESQNDELWRQLFPTVPYKSKYELFVKNAIESATAALQDFMSQYQAWRAHVKYEILRFRGENMSGAAGGVGPPIMLPISDSEIGWMAENIPFQPKLKFGEQ
jgi:hypothetical protein